MGKALSIFLLSCAAALGFNAGTSWCASQDTAAVAIDPEAHKIIQALGANSRQTQRVKIKVHDTMDEMSESGQMIQYGHIRSAVIDKPGRLWMESRGDRSNTTVWIDGALFTILDREANVYVQLDAPGTIEQTIDMLYDTYGISTPLADMLSSDIQEVLMNKALTCRYLGLRRVGESMCHHIAAAQQDIDWQVWVDQGDDPKIRKIVITYKNLDGSPRYSAELAGYEQLDTVSDAAFAFQPPPGAEKIQPVPRSKDPKSRLQ